MKASDLETATQLVACLKALRKVRGEASEAKFVRATVWGMYVTMPHATAIGLLDAEIALVEAELARIGVEPDAA